MHHDSKSDQSGLNRGSAFAIPDDMSPLRMLVRLLARQAAREAIAAQKNSQQKKQGIHDE
jgi:hypothetical protein